jgi:hypothetical protein
MSKEVEDFVAIAREACGAGERIFRKWLADPGRFLSENVDGMEPVLRELPSQDIERTAQIIHYFTKLSFYYLLKHLEEGEGPYTFELWAVRENVRTPLIDSLEDRYFRDRVRFTE